MTPNLIVSMAEGRDLSASELQTWQQGLDLALDAIPDGRLRLGFQSLARCQPGSAVVNPEPGCPALRLRTLDANARQLWRHWLQGLRPSANLSAHVLMAEAGRFMRSRGPEGPYAAQPGQQETPVASCRKSTHLLISNDAWNGVQSAEAGALPQASEDGQRWTLPDGRVYDPYSVTGAQTRVYRDAHAHAVTTPKGQPQGSLADVAFTHWAQDLQPDLPDQLTPLWHEIAQPEPWGLEAYWNPRNNPATWQHLLTHALVSGAGARLPGPQDAGRSGPAWGGHDRAGDFAALVGGRLGWCNPFSKASSADGPWPPQACTSVPEARLQDLWHAALNGRGRFIAAADAWRWRQGLDSLLAQVLNDAALPAQEQTLLTQTQSDPQGVLQAGFLQRSWRGWLQASAWQGVTGLARVPTWEAGEQLDRVPPEQRVIWSHNGRQAIRFDWAELSPSQQAALAGVPAAWALQPEHTEQGQSLWRYARGERSLEMRWGGPWRNRASVLGAIVHSQPWVLNPPDASLPGVGHAAFAERLRARPRLVFVGALDGALHGFDGATGLERLAYVPLGALPALRTWADPAGSRPYTVDGSPFAGDFWDGQVWRTALVGSLGRGGRGYFVLDVTDPSRWTDSLAAPGVWLDRTDDPDPDLGHLVFAPSRDPAQPDRSGQVTQLNNGRWAVLLGNGVNSASEQAVLLVQYLDGARERLKLPTDGQGGQGNGLSTPQVIDLDGDGRADLVYAGDQWGQLWKFDLSSGQSAAWGVAWGGRPLLVARDALGQPQPITVPPMWTPHPLGGLMLSWGTGRALSEADLPSKTPQSLYSVWDNTPISQVPQGLVLGASQPLPARWRQTQPVPLVEQRLSPSEGVGDPPFYRSTREPVPYAGQPAARGWFLDLPTPGERVLEAGRAVQRLFWVHSDILTQPVPSADACEERWLPAQGRDYLLDVFTGSAPASASGVLQTGDARTPSRGLVGVIAWRSGGGPRLWRGQGLGEWLGAGGGDAATPAWQIRVRGAGSPSARLGWRRLR
ncbi:PilC/PilY family type IV pilus protein [Curvibacter sp. RS43]|uniref:pilus assembly protein n=1 Tax=Curvibacter microcysteis TaxID=3026419 RepID=UPI00236092E6|nr:PilC/PilY family type IV pilus protein [Curvibacter sp. RS43]MDD0809527.1 PilC/PilY family type IV pilus protein [Curvibacter sp. RS43]